jgi:hypothetical protein
MDIQTRKLKFIEEFLKIESEELISRLENTIINADDFDSLPIEKLNSRIQKSEDDFKNGKFKTQEDLENQSTNW